MPLGRILAAAALIAAALPLTACSSAPQQEARVVVRVAPSAHPQRYEVHLAQASGGFRSAFPMRSGETRSVAVPAGWVTVRVAGLCVVPASASGTTTVDVRSGDCTIA